MKKKKKKHNLYVTRTIRNCGILMFCSKGKLWTKFRKSCCLVGSIFQNSGQIKTLYHRELKFRKKHSFWIISVQIVLNRRKKLSNQNFHKFSQFLKNYLDLGWDLKVKYKSPENIKNTFWQFFYKVKFKVCTVKNLLAKFSKMCRIAQFSKFKKKLAKLTKNV